MAALQAINSTFFADFYSACSGMGDVRSSPFLTCLVANYSTTIYHPSGTVMMGPPGSPGSVVDSRLRVIGLKGLRVVDASIMPIITSGNLNAPTIMIGERASDFIRRDYNVTTAVLNSGQQSTSTAPSPMPPASWPFKM